MFPPGRLMATPGALEALKANGKTPWALLLRHLAGDWGEELCNEDRRLNEAAVRDGSRILSAYRTTRGARLWVITEADRSVTTVLLAEEY